MPDYIEPQLGTLVSEAPGRGWVHEIKFDGYLIQARIERGQAVLRSRKGLDWSHMFQEIAADCGGLPDCILDGEICAVDADGMPSFAGLQQALSSGKTEKLIYYVFDLIWLAEKDYKPWALSTRKKVRERR
jgi:bifunctional non-homologous end joining protein LigD